jgi:RHH-type proline utilization regulon transcriptional repressor/proline dehydrogenase/delta 1-pyrroline-5-carboxylate dehydrogenase
MAITAHPAGSPDVATGPGPEGVDDVAALVEPALVQARRWVEATAAGQSPAEQKSTGQLAALVHDHDGVEFTLRFVDRVARPEDDGVAARELVRLARPGADPHAVPVPGFLSPLDRLMMGAGALTAPVAPRVVVPLARRRLRQMVGHLVQDAGSARLTRHLAAARAQGVQLNLNLLGEAVLGEQEADRRLASTLALLGRGDVDHVSVKASAVASQLNPWDLAGSRDRLVERLLPLYLRAAARSPHAFINLDMEEYKDLHLTVEVFTRLLERPELAGLQAGIVLQAYLPDALPALEHLAGVAAARTARGGAPIKVRLVKGANLAMERVDAQLHDWPQAPYTTKADVDANYVRLLDRALRPEHAAHLRIGVASHNLPDVALAHLLSRARGVEAQLDVEMLQGMAPAQARAVRADVGRLVLYTPVVHRGDFDVAVTYLVRRLEENAHPENYLYALFAGGEDLLAAQEQRFRDSVRDRDAVPVGPRRTQDRAAEARAPVTAFTGAADTDPSLPANRAWALAALAAPAPELVGPVLTDPAEVDAVLERAASAAPRWAATPAAERARLLRAAGAALEAARGELLTVMAHEGGKTVAEADPEVSEAVDFATYYADRALELGAAFTPARVVVVTPPWNFPVAIPLGGVLAALAAGSAVVVKPAAPTRRCAEVGVVALHAAGIPREVLQLVHTDESDAGRRLVTHPAVEAVVLTGATETARLFRSWRPDLHLLAETSGKNALVVTPSADPDLAVADLLRSAFGHAGQKCSAASLVIAVGSVATSGRFRRQLVDAVASLRVGWATDVATTTGPLIGAPSPDLSRALTTLEPGETWLVQPRRLDEGGRLWSPGVRAGVAPGSWFHTTEVFGPVLGVMAARDLDEAVAWQNATGYGLTGGLHSLDDAEVERWLERVEVGNAYVNRAITGAVVQRQPFGGWKGSAVGPGAKAGGPHYVAQFGTWADGDLGGLELAPAPGAAAARVLDAAAGALSGDDDGWLVAAARSDEHAWVQVFSRSHDVTGLRVEANLLRYRPLPGLLVRVGEGSTGRALVRVLLAAARAGTPVELSAPPECPLDGLLAATGGLAGVALRREDDERAAARVRSGVPGERLRALGAVDPALRVAAAESGASLLDAAPLASGRRELLTVLREQAVSRTLHRFGHVRQR